MRFNHNNRKRYIASITDQFVKGKMDRRTFMRTAGKLGLGVGALGASSMMPSGPRGGFISQAHAQDIEQDPEMMKWLADVGQQFSGQTIRLATESTPPSNAINSSLKQFFEQATGIKVEIEVLPLEQVLQKLTLDVASGLGTYDLYYIDQSWMASFSGDVIDPREKYESDTELAMPNYNMDDFLPALVDGISMYDDIMVGVPYDIPIFITMYRKDLYEELGLSVPTTMEQYLGNAVAIQEAKGPEIFGTTGQMKSGHYSLECDWTCWLWSHGGSIFNSDGKFSGNDEAGIVAMEYWNKLKENMPEGVTTWTWDGQGQSVLQGIAGQALSWGEFFPWWDDPEASKVSGLMEAAVPPAPASPLRAPKQASVKFRVSVIRVDHHWPYPSTRRTRMLRGYSHNGQPLLILRCTSLHWVAAPARHVAASMTMSASKQIIVWVQALRATLRRFVTPLPIIWALNRICQNGPSCPMTPFR